MNDLINKFFLSVTIALLRFADSVFDIFRILAGTQKIRSGNEERTIFEVFLSNNAIAITFSAIFMVGIVAGGVCTMIGVFRSMRTPEAKSPQKVFGRYIASMFGTFLIFILLGVFIGAATTILGLLEEAFNNGKPIDKMGNTIINSLIRSTLTQLNINADWELIDIHDGSVSAVVTRIIGRYKIHDIFKIELPGNWGKPSIFPLGNEVFKNLRTSFPYFLGLLISGILLVSTLISSFKLVLRLFDVMLLYTVLPLPMAVYSIDNGQRLKTWKTQMIQTVVMAFGMVFSINIFLVFMPTITGFTPFNGTANSDRILNATMQLLMLAGGSFAIFKGQKMLEEILGISEGATSITGGSIKSALSGAKNMVGKMFGKGKDKSGGKEGGGIAKGGAGRSKAGSKGKSNDRKEKMKAMKEKRLERRESNKNGGRAVNRAKAKQERFQNKLDARKNKLDARDAKIQKRADDKRARKQQKIDDRQARVDNKAKAKEMNQELKQRKADFKQELADAKKNHTRGDYYDFTKK